MKKKEKWFRRLCEVKMSEGEDREDLDGVVGRDRSWQELLSVSISR